MKLLLDANLSRRLVTTLDVTFPGSTHVSQLGAVPDDEAIWNHAKTNGYMIVSKDSDFYRMSVAWGPPPKVLWLRIGNGPTGLVETVLRARLPDIEAFAADRDAALLIIESA